MNTDKILNQIRKWIDDNNECAAKDKKYNGNPVWNTARAEVLEELKNWILNNDEDGHPEIDFNKTTIHDAIRDVVSAYAEQKNITVDRVYINWYLPIGMPPVVMNVEVDSSKRG